MNLAYINEYKKLKDKIEYINFTNGTLYDILYRK